MGELDAHCGREIEMLRVCATRRGAGMKGGTGVKVSVRVHQSWDPVGEMKETLKDRLALLMFKVDVPLQIRKQEKEWDPKGDGTITKVWCLSSLAWLARTYAFASDFASDAREQTSGIRGA